MNAADYLKLLEKRDPYALSDLPLVLERGTIFENKGALPDDDIYRLLICNEDHLGVIADKTFQGDLLPILLQWILSAPSDPCGTLLFALGKAIPKSYAPLLRELMAESADNWSEEDRYQALIAFENALDDEDIRAVFRQDQSIKATLNDLFANTGRNAEIAGRILRKISITQS